MATKHLYFLGLLLVIVIIKVKIIVKRRQGKRVGSFADRPTPG